MTRLLEKRIPCLAGIGIGPDSVSPCEIANLDEKAVGVGLTMEPRILAYGVPGIPTVNAGD
jgi:hypothetical protein